MCISLNICVFLSMCLSFTLSRFLPICQPFCHNVCVFPICLCQSLSYPSPTWNDNNKKTRINKSRSQWYSSVFPAEAANQASLMEAELMVTESTTLTSWYTSPGKELHSNRWPDNANNDAENKMCLLSGHLDTCTWISSVTGRNWLIDSWPTNPPID